LNKFLDISLCVDKIELFGNSITSNLQVMTDNFGDKRNLAWTQAEEINEFNFRLPTSSKGNLVFKASNFVYHLKKMVIHPYIQFGLKDQKFLGIPIRLSKLGNIKIPLPKIGTKGFNIPSSYAYSTTGLSVVSSDAYDFSLNIQEITPDQAPNTFSSLKNYDQLYKISLRNLADRTDTIHLSVLDLPTGYSYKIIGPSDVSINGEITNVYLLVSPKNQLFDPPGLWDFTIKATSKTKIDNNFDNATTSKTASLTIPEIIDYDYNLDVTEEEPIVINAGESLPIGLFGKNLGNQADTIRVNATLITDHVNKTWDTSYPISAYTTSSSHLFSDVFSFTFAIDEIYPSPGVYRMDIDAQSLLNPALIKRKTIFVNFTEAYAVETSITPTTSKIAANWETNFTLLVKNTGNIRDNFTITIDSIPPYIADHFKFNDTILDLEPMDSVEVVLTLDIVNASLFPTGIYDIFVTTISNRSGSVLLHDTSELEIEVLEADFTPPKVEYKIPFYFYENLTYPLTELQLGPSWIAYDDYPGDFEVFVNGSLHKSGQWVDGTTIFVEMTNSSNPYPVGHYNITLVVADNATMPNLTRIEKWVTIENPDLNPPSILSSGNLVLPSNFANDKILSWNCSDEYLLDITLYENDLEVPKEKLVIEQEIDEYSSWVTKYTIPASSLSLGVWNYTLSIQDMGNNTHSLTILVTIMDADNDKPIITITPSAIANQEKGEVLAITATDLYPTAYELFINSTLEYSGHWISDTPLSFDIDTMSLVLGDNQLQLDLYDEAANIESYNWILTLRDVDIPILQHDVGDFVSFEHNVTTINSPYWQITDINPGNYTIYRDSVLIEEGSWQHGNNTINVPILELLPGVYNFDAYFRDSSGNTLYTTSTVSVVDVIAPYIWPQNDIKFEPFYTPDWFEFTVIEQHLKSYELYRNDTLVETDDLTADFPVVFVSLSSIQNGTYFYRLEVTDESDNIGEFTVKITVTDYNPPLIKRPADMIYPEGTIGETLLWEIIESNPYNYSLYHNDEILESGELTTTNLSISLDGLSFGVHKYLLLVFDTKGNSHSCTTYVSIVDIIAPIIPHLGDYRFAMSDTQAKLIWNPIESNPDSYTIRVNSVVFESVTNWDGSPIIIEFAGWSSGTYSIQLEIVDSYGNIAIDNLIVEIVLSEETSSMSQETSPAAPGFTVISTFILLVIFGMRTILIRRKQIYLLYTRRPLHSSIRGSKGMTCGYQQSTNLLVTVVTGTLMSSPPCGVGSLRQSYQSVLCWRTKSFLFV
jgi:hypothetical protein